MSSFEDARRFVDLAKAGWVDPTVNQIELIETLCDNHEEIVANERDEAAEEKEADLQDEIADLKSQCNFEAMEHEELTMTMERILRCLRDAHKDDIKGAIRDAERRVAERLPPPPTPDQVEAAHSKRKRGRPRKNVTP